MNRFLFLIVFFFSSSAFAVDYYWRVGGLNGPTPSSACQNFATANGLSYCSVDFVNSSRYLCHASSVGNCSSPNNNQYIDRFGDSCPQYFSLNPSTGLCVRTSCPVGQDLVGGACLPGCQDGFGRDELGNCISATDICDAQSPHFNYQQCLDSDAPCPGNNQILINGKKTCVEEPQEQEECSPTSAGYIGVINGVAYCNPQNKCPAGQEFGIVQGKQVCVPNLFQPPTCSPPEVLTSVGCLAADSPFNPETQAPTVTSDNNATGSTTPDPNNPNVTVHTGAGAAAGQNGEQVGSGQCDPTKPNYAICIGEVQTADADPAQPILKKTDQEGTKYLDSYFEKSESTLYENNSLNPVTTGATGLTNLVKNVVPQSTSCTQFTLQLGPITKTIPCEKFNSFKQWFGWFLWLSTVYYIVMLALTPVKSQV